MKKDIYYLGITVMIVLIVLCCAMFGIYCWRGYLL